MSAAEGRHIWVFAIAASLLLHGLMLFILPDARLDHESDPIMTVRLTMMPAKTKDEPVQSKPQPVRKTFTESKPEVVKKPLKKAEKPIKTEISDLPADKKTEQNIEYTEDATASDKVNIEEVRSHASVGTPVEITSLQITKKVLPDYSSFSRKRKEEGTVSILITISSGRVIKAEIERSSGYERLDASALRAVKQWLFVNTDTIRVRVPISFKLER